MIDSHVYTQRIDMKSYGTMEGVYINGAPQGITFHETDNFTLYPASILSVNKNRFTKHYFIGDKRVASRIGTGLFNNVYGRNGSYVTAGQQDYAERMNQIQKQKEAYYKQQGIAPGVPTMKGAYGDPENTKRGYNSIIDTLGNHDVPQGWIQTPRPNTTPNTNPGPPVSWNDPSNPDDPQAGYGYIANDTTKEETFFYHSDHLGSTSYITDDKANITQYDAYLPYGELLVDEHSSSEDLPYKFNGKQFDKETGLYYYGARYMNPITSLWYEVDSRIGEMPFSSSYSYCDNHPINFIDKKGDKKLNWFILTKGIPPQNDIRNNSAYFRNNYDNNVVNIWAHGLKDPSDKKYRQQAWGTGISKLSSGERWMEVASYLSRDVSLFARRIEIADKGWRKRNNGHPILVLHSCASSTFAQEISASKEFKGVIIIAPDVTLHTTKEKGEWLNSLVYGKHYEKKRSGLWHVYMNGSPLKDAAGKEIIYGAKAQPGTRGFDYRLNTKKK